jgi:hypothetical protein
MESGTYPEPKIEFQSQQTKIPFNTSQFYSTRESINLEQLSMTQAYSSTE